MVSQRLQVASAKVRRRKARDDKSGQGSGAGKHSFDSTFCDGGLIPSQRPYCKADLW